MKYKKSSITIISVLVISFSMNLFMPKDKTNKIIEHLTQHHDSNYQLKSLNRTYNPIFRKYEIELSNSEQYEIIFTRTKLFGYFIWAETLKSGKNITNGSS